MQILVLVAGILIVALLFWQGERLHIMPVPTNRAVRKAALDMLKGLQPQRIIELGGGWGGMTRALMRAFPNTEVTAYERSLLPYAVSRLTTDTRRQDIFTADLRNTDIVFCYLSPWHMTALAPKFASELKGGATVISVSFPIPGRTPIDQITAKGIIDIPVYLYRYGE